MTYIKINNVIYPASISGRMVDHEWGDRSSKIILLTMSYAEAVEIFINDVSWSIIEELQGEGEVAEIEYDNSDFCLAGDIIDHRDGTLSIKMGKLTDKELLNIITGGTQNDEG